MPRRCQIGGARCLDFLNTTEDGGVERLTSYAEFVIWSKAAGLIDGAEQRRLQALAAKATAGRSKGSHPGAGGEGSAGRFVQGFGTAADVGRWRRSTKCWRRAASSCKTQSGKSGLRQRWEPDGPELRQPLLILLREAAELLSAPARANIHHCAGDDCGWFFLDTSRNQSRRWCEMETCGNKAKARAHYHRQRAVS